MTGRELVAGDVALGSRWTVIGEPRRDERRRLRVVARCSCGTVREVRVDQLRSGQSRSCGCLMREMKAEQMTRHGWSRTPEYQAWQDMIQRCTNPRVARFKHYGARGIAVCARWSSSFENFLSDMGARPPGLTIDRIDVNGNYEPGNCRWATWSEQRINQRPAVRVLSEGVPK